MLWLTILAALIVAALAIVYVAWPLVRPTRFALLDEDNPLTALIQRKDALLLSIKELEFDLRTGKLSEEDHQRLDQRLRHQAVTLLRQIEQTAPQVSGLEAELEAAIQQQRRVANRSTNGQVASTFQCPHCQTPVGRADKFCPQCGQKLTPLEANAALSLS